jgi:NAD(P)-dependent dehydrogenase (short-subunit alcohol dehydrogenase family)
MSRWFAPADEQGKMNLKLENKTALVSASTAGIGFAIALELARESTRVFVNRLTQTGFRPPSEPRGSGESRRLHLFALSRCSLRRRRASRRRRD